DVGGFDEQLRTAEDLDFHLRIARRWQIGVVAEPLVRAIRGHDGLSALASAYDDYTRVIERAVDGSAGIADDAVRMQALATAYLRNARGMLFADRWREAWRWRGKALRTSNADAIRADAREIALLILRRALSRLLGRGPR